MSAKSARLNQLEAWLDENPGDPELRYFIAIEYLGADDLPEAAKRMRSVTEDSTYVPAFLQAGQFLARLGQDEEACTILRRGVELARLQGNQHAQGEMEGLLASLE